MISVFIASRGLADDLTRTLGPLVSAAVEGLVSDVTVIHNTPDAACEAVAEDTGCAYRAADELERAIARARGDWCLLLEEGAIAGDNWTDAARSFMTMGTGRGRFRRSRDRRRRSLASLFGRRGALADGLLLPRTEAASMAKTARSLEELARGRAARRIGAVLHPPL